MTAQPIDRTNVYHPRWLALFFTGLMVWWVMASLGVYFFADLPAVWSAIMGWLFTIPYVLGAVALSWAPELADTPGE